MHTTRGLRDEADAPVRQVVREVRCASHHREEARTRLHRVVLARRRQDSRSVLALQHWWQGATPAPQLSGGQVPPRHLPEKHHRREGVTSAWGTAKAYPTNSTMIILLLNLWKI